MLTIFLVKIFKPVMADLLTNVLIKHLHWRKTQRGLWVLTLQQWCTDHNSICLCTTTGLQVHCQIWGFFLGGGGGGWGLNSFFFYFENKLG